MKTDETQGEYDVMNEDEMKLALTLIEFHDDIGYYIPLESGFFDINPEDQSILLASARAGIPHQALAQFIEQIRNKPSYNHDYLFENLELDQKTRVVLATFRDNPFISDEARQFCIDLYEGCRKYDSKRNPSPALRRAVVNKHGTKCFFCKKEIAENEMHMDHFIPYSRGGKTNLNNLVPACGTCNIQKGDKPFVKFLQWRVR